ncbi:fibronectin type III domain-containing protein [Streptomyces sp. NPDC051987]|uniref:fibronectin type III domain-containing protein n=1 Tax=Streptomyces sp. NPDC051987 TaxID=3155808 RepID=UPI003449B502
MITGSDDAWLPTTGRGAVSLVNGAAGRTGVELDIPGAKGHELTVRQEASTVLVTDPVSGTVTRIDTDQLTAGPALSIGHGTEVFPGRHVAYLVDYAAGTVTRIDPVSMRPTAAPYHVRGTLGRQAVVDTKGTLWLPVLSDGTVLPVGSTGPGTAVQVGGKGAADSLVMTLAGGTPVAVDQTSGQVMPVGRGGGQTIALPSGIAGSGADLLVPSSSDTTTVPMVANQGGTPALVLTDVKGGTSHPVPLGSDVGSDRLGAPVEAGSRVYVPDYTTGQALTYDLSSATLGGRVTVTGKPGQFDAEVVGDVAYFNSPGDTGAVAVGSDGTVHHVAKVGQGIPVTDGRHRFSDGVVPSPTTSSTPDQSTRPASVPTSAAPPVSAPVVTQTRGRAGTGSGSSPGTGGGSPPTSAPPHTPKPSSKPTTVDVAPLAPADVAATPGSGYVDVTWKAPASGGTIADYQVAVAPHAGTQTTQSATSIRVTGLTCSVKYTFTVSSVGTDGRKVPAGAVTAHPCRAPAAPAGFTATVRPAYTRVVDLAWKAVTATGAGSVRYVVSWSGASTGSSTISGTSLTVSELYPGHSYTFQVKAEDDAGAGPASSRTAVPGSKDTKSVTMQKAVKIYSSYTEDSSVAWSAAKGDKYTAYCTYANGQKIEDDGAYNSTWMYVTDGRSFGWASKLWLPNPDDADSLLRCRTPIAPVP